MFLFCQRSSKRVFDGFNNLNGNKSTSGTHWRWCKRIQIWFCYYYINAYICRLFITKPVLVFIERPQASCVNRIKVSFGVLAGHNPNYRTRPLIDWKLNCTCRYRQIFRYFRFCFFVFFLLNVFLTFSTKFGTEMRLDVMLISLTVETPNSNKEQKQKTLVASNNIARPPAFTGSRQAPGETFHFVRLN